MGAAVASHSGRGGWSRRPFYFPHAAAGEYRLAALAEIEPGRQFDPDWLSQIMGAAVAVQLTDGEKRTQDLRIDRGPCAHC